MFDAHCDTLLKVAHEGSLHSNGFDVSFDKLSTYGRATQVFAIFNSGTLKVSDILNLINLLKVEAGKSPLAEFCVDYNDIINCNSPVVALVSLEGVGNTPDFLCQHIDEFYDAGVRIAGLTWNNDNPLCGGIGDNIRGLTERGRATLERMLSLGMVLDVSHISDKGFFDVAEIDGLNIIATHSNSRAVCPHNRNLTDDQFKLIADRGGVVGINTYPLFVNGSDLADVTDLARHIEHFCALGGERSICLGADFDGIDNKMCDIDSCEKMNILFDELAKLNYPEHVIRGIYCENFLNFFEKMKFIT